MPKNIQEERYRWVKMVEDDGLKLKKVLEVFPYSGRTLKRWLKDYRVNGKQGLIPKSTKPKTQRNETSIRNKERILEIRKQTKKCALKIHWQLEKEGLHIHERTIGKILKNENVVRKYRVKKIKYKYIR